MNLSDKQKRSLIFYYMYQEQKMKQREIQDHFKNYNKQEFSQSTISAGIQEGKIISKLELIENDIIFNKLKEEIRETIGPINPVLSLNSVKKFK
ncbi:MAG: hypothetical protein ACRC76_03190 [Proteocatella sp.]